MHWFWRVTTAIVAGVFVGNVVGSLCGIHVVSTQSTPGWFARVELILPITSSVGVIVFAVLTHLFRKRPFPDNETRCRKCGYILRGLPEPRCPECGERI